MIIVRLNGGLGNQLFQYAFGRRLSEMHQVPLKLDIRWFEKKIRDYELPNFCIKEDIATDKEVALTTRMTTSWQNRLARNIIQPLLPYYRRCQVIERQGGFDSKLLKTKPNIYLVGYWQNEQYFKTIENTLRTELAFKNHLDERNNIIANQINRTNAVSLHIRRGDYITNSEYQRIFGTCSLDYYNRAIQVICDKLSNPHFYVFSDDILWATENLKIPYPVTLISHNHGVNSYRDMQLMSLCKHNIIANSTFSWWGAWLNERQDKIVIAPKTWYADKAKNKQNLVPERWIRL